MEITTARVFLGLGANLGNCIENLTKAIDLLREHSIEIVAQSDYYQSEAWGYESNNIFYNCCIEVKTKRSSTSLLALTQEIEQAIGRKEKSSNRIYTDRLIDIDILFYGNLRVNNDKLTIPHPQIQERNFVLIPMVEIAPDFIHPGTKLTMTQLLINSKDNNHIKAVKKS